MSITQSARILVVDDVPDWRSTLCGVLQDEGFETSGVSTFEEAVELLNSGHYDIALLDIRLDETDEDNMRGLSLAREMREMQPGIKIVMITGYARVRVVNDAMQRSFTLQGIANDFLEKKDTGELVNLIKELV